MATSEPERPLARPQPPRADHQRHGHDRALLARRDGRAAVATIGTDTFRHYFFRFGESSSVAFFQYTGHESKMIAKPAGVFDERAGQFDHLSMDLPDEAALLALRQRLLEPAREVTDVVDHGLMRSIYFTDPNGIALEASWWAEDPTAVAPDYDSDTLLQGPRPGAGVRRVAGRWLAGDPEDHPRRRTDRRLLGRRGHDVTRRSGLGSPDGDRS